MCVCVCATHHPGPFSLPHFIHIKHQVIRNKQTLNLKMCFVQASIDPSFKHDRRLCCLYALLNNNNKKKTCSNGINGIEFYYYCYHWNSFPHFERMRLTGNWLKCHPDDYTQLMSFFTFFPMFLLLLDFSCFSIFWYIIYKRIHSRRRGVQVSLLNQRLFL